MLNLSGVKFAIQKESLQDLKHLKLILNCYSHIFVIAK